MPDFESFVDSLAGDEPEVRATKKAAEVTFPCQACGGTGIWNQRRHNKYGDKHCFACKGTGTFKTSPEHRAKAKASRVAAKQRKVDTAKEQNAAHDEGALLEWLTSNADWNGFASSLVNQHASGRVWSEGQVAAARKMVAKTEAKRAEREAAKQRLATEVDLTPIFEMFAAATRSGYKRPLYRAEGLRLKPGKGGSLSVLCDERTQMGHFGEQPLWLGKIEGGSFRPGRSATEATAPALQAIAADPKGAAVRYGQRTGRCSCCGRELTKHTSIEAGIGPICAAKWGL